MRLVVSRTHSFSVFNHIISCRFCIKLTFSHVFIGFIRLPRWVGGVVVAVFFYYFGARFYCFLSALSLERKKKRFVIFFAPSYLQGFSIYSILSSIVSRFTVLFHSPMSVYCAAFLKSQNICTVYIAFGGGVVVYSNSNSKCAPLYVVVSFYIRTLNDKRQCIFIQTIWK